VKRNVTAAVAVEQFDAALPQQFGWGNHVGSLGIAAEGDDRGVLQQEQHVANSTFFSQFDKLLLQTQASGVVNSPELDDGDHD
jgi:hypothetical protein